MHSRLRPPRALTGALRLARPLTLVLAAAALVVACDDDDPVAPDGPTEQAVATLRSVTERYHDVNAATADGFVLLHECETRGDEGPVGTVYYHPGRLTDGVIDPAMPDALIYEPDEDGSPTLLGAEFAVPFTLWTGQAPPDFLGNTFQREDEFGVFGLHAWVWRDNPDGLFAESNPTVSCGVE